VSCFARSYWWQAGAGTPETRSVLEGDGTVDYGKSMTRRTLRTLALCGAFFLGSWQSMAMISVNAGSTPLRPHLAESFPLGVDKVANLDSRLGYWEGPPFGGGLYTFEYSCRGTKEFQRALELFAAVRSRNLEVVLHDGTPNSTFLKEQGDAVWTMTVWQPGHWHRLYSHPTKGYRLRADLHGQPVPAPRLDLYLGLGAIDWEGVEVPKNISVVDKRIRSAKYQPTKGALLFGEVTDMTTGRPVAGARVWIRQYDRDAKEYADKEPQAETGEMGEYRLEVVLPKGYYEICYSKDGYADRTEACSLSGGLQVEERLAQLVGEASISGVVVDTAGNPVPDVWVEVRSLLGMDGRPYRRLGYNPIKPFAVTDSAGRFEIKSLPLGYTHLYSRKPDLHSKSNSELHKIPSYRERGMGMETDVRIVVEGTGTVRGNVVGVGENTGRRQVSVHMSALDSGNRWGGSMHCREGGGFAFKNVPPGRYRLSTMPMLPGMGDDPNAKIVEMGAGVSLNVEVKYSTGRDLVDKE